MSIRLAALGVFVAFAAHGPSAQQDVDDPRRDDVVTRVVANVAKYHATLPSITTDEDIVSSLSQHGLYRAHGTAHSTLRISVGKPGEQLNEARTYLVLDGKAVPPGKKVSVPFELDGAFSRVADTFFSAAHVGCYSFTLLPQAAPDGSVELAFRTSSQLPTNCTNRKVVITGLARLDPGTAQVRHLERTVSSSNEGEHTITFIAVDYGPAVIGGQSLWLPTLLTADLDHGKGTFSARYSNYHRFTGKVTLLPGVIPVETGAPEPPASTSPLPPQSYMSF